MMFRHTLLSLLLGIVLSLMLLAILSPSRTQQQPTEPVLEIKGSELLVLGGEAERRNGALHIGLNELGMAAVAIPVEAIAVHQYPFIKLELNQPPSNLVTTLFWKTMAAPEEFVQYAFETRPRQTLWVAANELPGWDGELQSLGLFLTGEPASEVRIKSLELHSYSLWVELQAMFNNWTAFTPWQRDSMNNYDGVTKLSQFYPATVMALILALSLIAHALLRFIHQRKLAPDWRVAGAIALLCWLALDLPWQYKLLRQVADTRQQFAGKSDAEKLSAGPDAAIYNSVAEALAHIPEAKARVFVASNDSYIGLRSAYYFYPHNVFWKLYGRKLPYDQYLRPGDYIFVAYPSSLEVLPESGTMTMKRNRYHVEVLTNGEAGALLRLIST